METSQLTLSAEHQTLLAYLNAQREHALGILEGLDQEALLRPVLPSGWSCLGMIHHLTFDIEQFWFRAVIAGEPAAIEALAAAANFWQVRADASATTSFDQYRQEIDRANAIISTADLDAAPAWWPAELFGDWRLNTVREIIMHVMTEVAGHAGHLDVVRELIDGRQWLVLTE